MLNTTIGGRAGALIQPIRLIFSLSCTIKAVRRYLLFLFLILSSSSVFAQKLDTMFFNLYTDSLKKGTYNYINVDGRFSDGSFRPLGIKELKFSASSGTFTGNSLFVDTSFRDAKLTVRIQSRTNPKMQSEKVIYIKTVKDPGRLPTMEEVLGTKSSDSGSERRKKKR